LHIKFGDTAQHGDSPFKTFLQRGANGKRHGHEPLGRDFGQIVQLPHVGAESAFREYGCYAVVPPGVGLSASRKAFAAAKLGFRDAGIVIVSPCPDSGFAGLGSLSTRRLPTRNQ